MPQAAHPSELSPTARRTRRVIVNAAIETMARNPSATLAEIAEFGDVSRSTLHRHFVDRDDLLSAVDAECRMRFTAAETAAHIGDGGALDSLDRLAQEYLELGAVLGLVFVDNAPVDPDSWEDREGDQGLIALIKRGQQPGTSQDIDPQLSPDWVITTLWVLLFGAWQTLKAGAPRREVAMHLSRTFRKAVGR